MKPSDIYTFDKVISGADAIDALLPLLAGRSCWFCVTPLPNDQWLVTVKEDQESWLRDAVKGLDELGSSSVWVVAHGTEESHAKNEPLRGLDLCSINTSEEKAVECANKLAEARGVTYQNPQTGVWAEDDYIITVIELTLN